MALRDQPYLPLYVQDYLTDEKLNECSPETQGIYVKIMCLMHKSKSYGKILLKQKYKQNKSISLNFADQLVKHLTFTKEEISNAINELLNEEVCFLDGDFLCQKRMIADNELSLKRAEAGKKGGEKSKNFAQAKPQANSENENENVIANINELNIGDSEKKTIEFLCKKFGVSEMLHFVNYKLIVNCVICQNNLGLEKFKHFKDQCWNYFIYKDLSKEKLHSFKSFIGTPEEQYLNGGWNSDNWIKKHTDVKAKEAGIESVIYPKCDNKQTKYPGKIRETKENNLLKVITERKIKP